MLSFLLANTENSAWVKQYILTKYSEVKIVFFLLGKVLKKKAAFQLLLFLQSWKFQFQDSKQYIMGQQIGTRGNFLPSVELSSINLAA